ncbi:hypothetical protein ACFFRR_003780 [Megaselia abdita]
MLRTFIFVLLVTFVTSKGVPSSEENSRFWMKVGRDALKTRLDSENVHPRFLKAKNIIIYLGGGMGMTTLTASRIYKGQLKNQTGEEESLVFDDFPYTGLAKVYSTDKQVPDASSTATAIFTGSKTKQSAVSMDITCDYKDSKKGALSTFMEWAQAVGKRTGFVTTTRITNAPLATLYAKLCNKDWECDSDIPEEYRGIYKESGLQFLENGHRFNVVLGGGLSSMGAYEANETSKFKFPSSFPEACKRSDKRNLVEEWTKLDGNRAFVKSKDDLFKVDLKKTDHLLGLFRNGHLSYGISREDHEPSLEEMTEKAIEILNRPNSNGFVLLVENGQIDHAHHDNLARVALSEVLELDKAVKMGIERTDDDETLIIVTADHSQPLTFNGSPDRGNDILGTTNNPAYETLSYANGPGFNEHRASLNWNGTTYSNGTWKSVNELNRTSLAHIHLSTIPLTVSTHTGEDVPVYARGPGSSLIRGVFEQNYIGHVMSYVGCMGPAQDVDDECWLNRNGGEKVSFNIVLLLVFSLVVIRFS